jgi:hypothetical protein
MLPINAVKLGALRGLLEFVATAFPLRNFAFAP